jgi:hypothetical protein
LLQSLVGAFRGTVGLWMKCCGQILTYTKDCAQTLHERASELGASIRGHHRWHSMLCKDALIKEASCVLRGEVVGRQEIHHLCKAIGDSEDVAIIALVQGAFASREFDDEVDGGLSPGIGWHWIG